MVFISLFPTHLTSYFVWFLEFCERFDMFCVVLQINKFREAFKDILGHFGPKHRKRDETGKVDLRRRDV